MTLREFVGEYRKEEAKLLLLDDTGGVVPTDSTLYVYCQRVTVLRNTGTLVNRGYVFLLMEHCH
jgi:hypothetical protein